jgi:Mn2+/Fe2+ NRAMP family transporter
MRRLFRFEVADVLIAMSLAGLVNMAMLIMAAATFSSKGRPASARLKKRTAPSAAARRGGQLDLCAVAAGVQAVVLGGGDTVPCYRTRCAGDHPR